MIPIDEEPAVSATMARSQQWREHGSRRCWWGEAGVWSIHSPGDVRFHLAQDRQTSEDSRPHRFNIAPRLQSTIERYAPSPFHDIRFLFQLLNISVPFMFKYLVDELNKGRTLHGDTTQSAVISMVTALLIGCKSTPVQFKIEQSVV